MHTHTQVIDVLQQQHCWFAYVNCEQCPYSARTHPSRVHRYILQSFLSQLTKSQITAHTSSHAHAHFATEKISPTAFLSDFVREMHKLFRVPMSVLAKDHSHIASQPQHTQTQTKHTTTHTHITNSSRRTAFLCLDHADLLFKPSHTHPLSHTRKHAAFIAALLRVRESARGNVCVILICKSYLTYSLTSTLTQGHHLVPIHFKAYARQQLIEILSRFEPNTHTQTHTHTHAHTHTHTHIAKRSNSLFHRFVAYIVRVFEHGSRNIHELQYIINLLYPVLERHRENARLTESANKSQSASSNSIKQHVRTRQKRKAHINSHFEAKSHTRAQKKRRIGTHSTHTRTRAAATTRNGNGVLAGKRDNNATKTSQHNAISTDTNNNESDLASFQSLLVKLRPMCKALLGKLFYRNFNIRTSSSHSKSAANHSTVTTRHSRSIVNNRAHTHNTFTDTFTDTSDDKSNFVKAMPLSCKYLLIASFLASYNPKNMDARLFSPRNYRKKRRRGRRNRFKISTPTSKKQAQMRTRSRTKITGRGRRGHKVCLACDVPSISPVFGNCLFPLPGMDFECFELFLIAVFVIVCLR